MSSPTRTRQRRAARQSPSAVRERAEKAVYEGVRRERHREDQDRKRRAARARKAQQGLDAQGRRREDVYRGQSTVAHDVRDDLGQGEVVYTESSAKSLADGLARYPEFEAALRDSEVGHKAVAERFPFTSESSVRRWRAKEGVVLS